MQGLTQPTLLLKRFCESGTKNTLPVTNTDTSNPQLADLTNGFPIETQGDPTNGKLPPERADFNALGYLTTSYDYFYQAGGTFTFNSTIASAIGGYPLGSRLWHTNAGGMSMILRSTKDNNTDDFTQDESYIGSSWVIESMMGIDNSSISLLDYKFSDKVINNMSWVQSNGSWYSGSTYTNVMSHLKEDIAFQATSTPSIVVGSNGDFTSGTYVRDSGEDKTINGITYYAWSDTDTFYVILNVDDMSGSDALAALQGQPIYRYDSDESDMFLTIHKVAKSASDTIDGITINFLVGSDGHRIIASSDDTAFNNRYNANGGVAWYYILDITNNRFKLPRTKWNFVGTRSGSTGSFVPEALPNHTHFIISNTTTSNTNLTQSTPLARNSAGGLGNSDYTLCAGTTAADVVSSSGATHGTYKSGALVQQTSTEMYLYFYIGGFNQTAIEQTAGINSSTINAKVDLDLNNMNASATSKKTIVGWGMPSTTGTNLTLGASGSTYTAPADGYFYLSKQVGNVDDGVCGMYSSKLGFIAAPHHSYDTESWAGFLPVEKGDVVTINYTINGATNVFRFVYLEGNK